MAAPFTLTNPIWTATLAAAGNLQPETIETGWLVQVTPSPGLAVAGVALTPQTPVFTLQPKQDGGPRTLEVSVVGIGGVPTTVTAQLLSSSDNGLTWQNEGSTLALVATSTPAPQQITVTQGRLYALNLSALTLGTATQVNLFVSMG